MRKSGLLDPSMQPHASRASPLRNSYPNSYALGTGNPVHSPTSPGIDPSTLAGVLSAFLTAPSSSHQMNSSWSGQGRSRSPYESNYGRHSVSSPRSGQSLLDEQRRQFAQSSADVLRSLIFNQNDFHR